MEGGEREKGQVPRKKEVQEKDGHDCGQGGGSERKKREKMREGKSRK